MLSPSNNDTVRKDAQLDMLGQDKQGIIPSQLIVKKARQTGPIETEIDTQNPSMGAYKHRRATHGSLGGHETDLFPQNQS